MKKTKSNLALRKETIRAIAAGRLTEVGGGIELNGWFPQSSDKQCPAPAGAPG